MEKVSGKYTILAEKLGYYGHNRWLTHTCNKPAEGIWSSVLCTL